MWRILVPTVAFVFGAALAQPAAAQSGADLVRQSVAAQGGAAALSSAKTTIIKGEAKHWEPGQSHSPTGEARFLGDATYTQIVDNTARTARVDWDRDGKSDLVVGHLDRPAALLHNESESVGRSMAVGRS